MTWDMQKEEIKMHISKYQILTKVVDEKSLTKTAEIFNYTQSGVSYAIKALESELGCRLLYRNNKECKLTYEGECLIDNIRTIAELEERLLQRANDIQGLCAGKIRVGTMCSVSSKWLPHIIERFHADYPAVEFELIDEDYKTAEKMLEEEKLDCAFLPKPNSKYINHELLYMDKYYAILPKNHPFADADKVPISAFEQDPFIVPTEGLEYRLGDLFKNHNLNVRYNISTKDDVGTIAMVYAGLGITILSDMFIRCVDTSNVLIKELEVDAYRDLGFCLRQGREMSLATAKFRTYAIEWIKNNTI